MNSRTVMGIAVGILALIGSLVHGSAMAQAVDGKVIESMRVEMEQECIPIQRANPLNQNVTDYQILRYCSCVAFYTTKAITLNEFGVYRQTGHLPPAFMSKVHDFGVTCAGDAAQKRN